MLAERKVYYGDDLTVISISCDTSFGRDVKVYCEERGIKFIEFVVYFNGPREKDEYMAAYVARHASLLEIGDEFHIAVSQNRQALVEDLVQRVKSSQKPFALYSDKNEVIDGGGWEAIQEAAAVNGRGLEASIRRVEVEAAHPAS